jgi:hypothetical protein
MRRPYPAALLGLCALLGCADTTSSNGGDGGADTLSLDAFASAYYRALCGTLFRCPTLPEGGTALAIFRDEATCAARASVLVGANLDDLVSAARAGRIRYDGAVAARCLQEVTRRCVQSDTELARLCRSAFVGTLAPDAPCFRDEECAGGYCDLRSGSDRRCPGVCRAELGPGAACTDNRQCAGWSDLTATCAGDRCVAMTAGPEAGLGGACGIVVAGAAATSVSCGPGLVCVNSRCAAVVAAGAACVRGQPCAAGTLCVARPGATESTCTAAAGLVVNRTGEACAANAPPLCNPLERLRCDEASRTCVSLGDGTAGAGCMPGSDFAALTCNAGLRCDETSRTCQPLVAAEGACQRDSDCASRDCANGRGLARRCQ